jgi:guanylate kinase
LQDKIVIITAPSGSGKTTLVKRLLGACPELAFSVSACTRLPRAGEVHGKDYYFYDADYFKKLIAENAFVEWEMVYSGKYYGTLRSELQRIWEMGKAPLVEIDVQGALAIREQYPSRSITIFIEAPSLEILRERLRLRGTETEHTLQERIEKAAYELSFAPRFDYVIINEHIDVATTELVTLVKNYLTDPKPIAG